MATKTNHIEVFMVPIKETTRMMVFSNQDEGNPNPVGDLYIQKWAVHQMGDPEAIVLTVNSAND